MIWLPVLGLVIGVGIGLVSNVNIPPALSSYLSIAILASLDTVFGGIKASLEKNFDGFVFITGFFFNAIVAALLAYIGNQLSVDLYLAAVVAFGVRMFQNIAIIRRIMFNKVNHRHSDQSAADKPTS
ncbi:small basic family protein [Alicyclobacillus sp. SO9]|nr:small basic family protein [Alicyclobacillus sp. SO9]QQE80710.1 small basic family protein [Alicyclobacillus sp. SO9]